MGAGRRGQGVAEYIYTGWWVVQVVVLVVMVLVVVLTNTVKRPSW